MAGGPPPVLPSGPMGAFLTPLVVQPLSDGRHWMVMAPFRYRIGFAQSPVYVDVPTGFVTDFASIPKPFWMLTPPFGFYSKPAAAHDKLYHDGIVQIEGQPDRAITQIEADMIFDQAMKICAADDVDTRAPRRGLTRYLLIASHFVVRHVIYQGVRHFGHTTWNAYRAAEMATLDQLEHSKGQTS